MSKFKKEIIDKDFDLFTMIGNPIYIMTSLKLSKLSDVESYVGTIEMDGCYEINIWDECGVSVDGDVSKDIKMVKCVKPNYEHISNDDVPGSVEFRKSYVDFCKYSFKMSEVEYLRYKAFCEDHKWCKNDVGVVSGGGTVVSFMGTGLGNIVRVKCECCGLEVDITDNSSW